MVSSSFRVLFPVLGAVAFACGGKAMKDGEGSGGGAGALGGTSSSAGGDAGASGGSGSSAGGGPGNGSGGRSNTPVDARALEFSHIVAGRESFCGITRGDRRLVCVADDQIVSDEPGPFVSFDMSEDTSVWGYRCAIRESGELACWGSVGVPAPPGEFVEVSVGFFNACALRADGEVECWIPGDLGGTEGIERASPGFSVEMWSFCSRVGMLDASCLNERGVELLPSDDSGHLAGGFYQSVRAAPSAGCAAIVVAIPDQEYEEFGEILNRNNIACFSQGEARSKIDGLFGAFDVNVDEDGCALRAGEEGETPVACWGAFAGTVPSDVTGPLIQVSVSTELACVLRDTGTVRCWSAGS